jgi:hypothetical protein
MSSSGYKGILGNIRFRPDGTYELTVSRGELWSLTSAGSFDVVSRPPQDNSDGILRLTPRKWDIPQNIPFADLVTLDENNIPLRKPAQYRMFYKIDELGLCHTEREPRNAALSHCESPWKLER